MNKRRHTFEQADNSGPIELTQLGKAKRNHILSKTSALSGDIASLEDPKVLELYNRLTSELQTRSMSEDRDDAVDDSEYDETDQLSEVKKLLNTNPNTSEVAFYVHSITRELKDVCLGVDLKFLAYLIDMARVEANNIFAKDNGKTGQNPVS